jgi:hypothetical protein
MDISEKGQAAPANPADTTIHKTVVENMPVLDLKECIHNVDQDDAADLFAGAEDVFEYTEKEATKVLWKLDLILLSMVRHFLPLMCTCNC